MLALARFTHLEPLRNRKMQRVYRQLKFCGRKNDFVALWVFVVSQNAAETSLVWNTRDDDGKRTFQVPYTTAVVNSIEKGVLNLPSVFEGGFWMIVQYVAQRGALWKKGRILADQIICLHVTLSATTVSSSVAPREFDRCFTGAE